MAWIIPAVQSPEVYMESMYVMYFFSIGIAMDTQILTFTSPCLAAPVAVTIKLYIQYVLQVIALATSLSKVGHALYGVIKNTESVTLAV